MGANVTTPLKHLGAWESKSVDPTVYQAATDGFVDAIGYSTRDGSPVIGLTDGNNPPTTIRQNQFTFSDINAYYSFSFRVKKNDYWKVTNATMIFWISLKP